MFKDIKHSSVCYFWQCCENMECYQNISMFSTDQPWKAIEVALLIIIKTVDRLLRS